MALRRRAFWCVAGGVGVLLVLALFVAATGGARRPRPRIGQSFEEFRAYVEAETSAARRNRLPPFREVLFGASGAYQVNLRTQYYVRGGHYFLTHYVHFDFTNQTYMGISLSQWEWRLDL